MVRYINDFFRNIRYTIFIKYINFLNKVSNKRKFINTNDTLAKLFSEYGSDKGNINNKHNYSDYYDLIFSEIKSKNIKLLEVGLGSIDENVDFHMKYMGKNYKPLASLLAWRDYFVNGLIYGADIDKKILKNHDRIKTFYVDMLDEDSIKNMWKNIVSKMDIIIDDGFHSFEANKLLFENSFKNLKEKGIYIIEDVHRKPSNIKKFYSYFKSKKIKFEIVDLKHKNNFKDNCIIKIINK